MNGQGGSHRLTLWETLKLAAPVLAAGGVVLALELWAPGHMGRFTAYVDGLGAMGPLVFVAVNALAIALCLPQSAFTVAAGALFGWQLGALWAGLGMTLGATLCFLLARRGVRRRLALRFEDNEFFQRMQKLSEAHPLLVVILGRINPAMPFALTSYALGLSHVRTLPYALLTWFCMIPETVFLASGGRLLQAGAADMGGFMEAVLVLCAAAVALAAAGYLIKRRLNDVGQSD